MISDFIQNFLSRRNDRKRSERAHEFFDDFQRNPFLVCGFFTDDYLPEILHLRASLKALGIDYFLKRYASRGFWEANTRIKPEFLLDCVNRFPGRQIVYLDADCKVCKPLLLFNDFEASVGVYQPPAEAKYSHKNYTGTLYLKNSGVVREFLQEWIAAQRKGVLSVDQDSFDAAAEKCTWIDIQSLPVEYAKIFDRGDQEPVIEHYQGSRKRTKLQKKILRARNRAIALVLIMGLAYVAYSALT